MEVQVKPGWKAGTRITYPGKGEGPWFLWQPHSQQDLGTYAQEAFDPCRLAHVALHAAG